MRYSYYPGCSLSASAVEYDVSTRAVMAGLGVELAEIPDWTCCGASAVESVSRLLTYTLPARNLALAERAEPEADVLAPCSACYLNLLRVGKETGSDKNLLNDVNQVLAEEDLQYNGKPRVRHILDVLLNDLGADRIREAIAGEFPGLRVAPYYGCQILRPYPEFDDPEQPVSMEPLLEAAGMEIHEWNKGGKCCGASLMTTHKEVALKSVASILDAAQGADCVATVCPMCQMNLEAFQSKALQMGRGGEPVSVVYLPQLLGLAMGLSEKEVMLGKNLVLTSAFRKKIAAKEAVTA